MPYYQMPDQEQLYVREFGQGEPVLVLSGLGMQSWQWMPFLIQNSKQFKFIIPDWRGFGRSKYCRIPEIDAISSHWRDLEALIQQLKYPDFTVIAFSMGATTAMHGMKYGNFKQYINRYLHIDQAPKITVDTHWPYGLLSQQHSNFKNLLAEISLFFSALPPVNRLEDLKPASRHEFIKIWSKFILLQNGHRLSPILWNTALKYDKLQKHLLPLHRLDYLAWYINNYLYHDEDYRECLAQLGCPTTFFIGENSILYPSQGQKIIANSVKNAKQVIFERSGHAILINEPFKFQREISRFLLNRYE
ncbi:alpha/beta fold hydrolase [Acinetobacter sp. ANC 4173]|uniref:alpha/beta fold hydrolase n=1 Tax=Acinetobacter sp. ANC 4173 TaxID=2529837 RepID=UPI00103DEDDD|nr:alpha/beta hydrolase [Acinetobacter sp. ANC 4173]TCB81478.1 alpha/beta hydrolase [Acinetobacter sp. ANC 4173]